MCFLFLFGSYSSLRDQTRRDETSNSLVPLTDQLRSFVTRSHISIVVACTVQCSAVHMCTCTRVCAKATFADMCASAEKYVGTQGGGMDQAIALLAEPCRVCLLVPSSIHSFPSPLIPSICYTLLRWCELIRVLYCSVDRRVLFSSDTLSLPFTFHFGMDWIVIGCVQYTLYSINATAIGI